MGKGFGGFPGFGGANIGNLMKQAQKMQEEMAKAQEEAKTKEFDATVGGGAVKVVVTGERKIKEIIIDSEAATDVEMLQDLLVVATNSALEKAEQSMSSAISGLTGGLNIPGL